MTEFILSDEQFDTWGALLVELEAVTRAANESGLRYLSPRGNRRWDIRPHEYLALAARFRHAPAEVRDVMREISK